MELQEWSQLLILPTSVREVWEGSERSQQGIPPRLNEERLNKGMQSARHSSLAVTCWDLDKQAGSWICWAALTQEKLWRPWQNRKLPLPKYRSWKRWVGAVRGVSFNHRSQCLVLSAAWFSEMGISKMGLTGLEMLPHNLMLPYVKYQHTI